MLGILIVDDSLLIRSQLSAWAINSFPGLERLLAESGEEAVTIAHDFRGEIALAIVDYNMEGINGVETIERLGSVLPRDRAFILSANIQELASERIAEMGIRFLGKPLKQDDFIELVSGMIKEDQ